MAKGGKRVGAGKKPGSKHTKTLQWEELGHSLVTLHSARANRILSECDDETFLDNYAKLLEYFRPKLARSEVNQTGDNTVRILFTREDGNH